MVGDAGFRNLLDLPFEKRRLVSRAMVRLRDCPALEDWAFEGEAELLQEGRSSVVVALAALSRRGSGEEREFVLKIPRVEQWPSLRREVQAFSLLSGVVSDKFVLPRLEAFVEDPFSIVMNRLGLSLGMGGVRDVQKTGEAVGDFLGELYAKFGLVHGDVYPNNLTREPDGRTGILDLAAVRDGEAWENFVTPLLYRDNIAPYAAFAFTRRTGVPIDPQRVREQALQMKWSPEAGDRPREHIERNIADWEGMARSRKAGAEKRKACGAFPKRGLKAEKPFC